MITLAHSENWNDSRDLEASDLRVVELKIIQKEGHIAKATLKIADFKIPESPYVRVSENGELLFQGVISGFTANGERLSEVELLCLSPDFDKDLKTLIATSDLPYSSLFFQNRPPKTSDVLEASNKLFAWDEKTGAVYLTDYFKGKREIDLGRNYLKNTLKIRRIQNPSRAAELTVRAHLSQRLEGSFDASPYIARAFPQGVISSLTPKALTLSWPKSGQKLGEGKKRSGYEVIKAYLDPIRPLNAREHTEVFWGGDGKRDIPKRLKIHYFKGYLRVGWRYFQAREEEFVLSAEQKLKPRALSKPRPLRFAVSIALPPSEKPAFFETLKGRELIAYAERVLAARLKATLRHTEISCGVPWELAKNLSLNDSVTIDSNIFGEGKIGGKVTGITLSAKGLDRIAEIRMSGTEKVDGVLPPALSALAGYSAESFAGDEIVSQDKLEGISAPILLGKNLVENVIVTDSAEEQEARLRGASDAGSRAIDSAFDLPTSVRVILKDLRGADLLKRRFHKRMAL